MLLGDRRQGLMHICLVGMEVALITPFATLLLHPHGLGWSPAVTFCGLLTSLLLWILALELLNRFEVGSLRHRFAVAVLVFVSTLAVVRLWLHWGAPIGDLSWLRSTFDALFNMQEGLRPELVLVVTNLLLWHRAASATKRSLDFFDVGVSFRLGILILILGGGLLMHVTGYDVTVLFWLYLGLGLMAVALARIRDKAASGGSVGPAMPTGRLAQLAAAVVLTVGSTASLALVYTPESIKTILGWLGPVWTGLGILARPLIMVLLWLIEIVINIVSWVLARLMVGVSLDGVDTLRERLAELVSTVQWTETSTLTLPPWLLTSLRYAGVLLALLIVVGVVLLCVEKVRALRRPEEVEGQLEEEITLGGSTVGRGWRWLRDRVSLVRRFGVGRGLLAAISVQNMYANLCRMAGRRGYPRHPAQPPDRYLPVLVEAFDGHNEALSSITMAYMRVHYGDRAVTMGELARLRKDYDQVGTAEQQVDE